VIDFHPVDLLVRSIGARMEKLEPMPGGASSRRYFRIRLRGGSTAIAMFAPDGDRPEEITKTMPETPAKTTGRAARSWPFLEVRALLSSCGVRVPSLLAESTDQGWLLLEDLGEETLAVHLATHPEERATLYRRAVTDLRRAQDAMASLPSNPVILDQALDEELLLRELEHFREWALEARGYALSLEDRSSLAAIFGRLARSIAALPRGFVHRDYQSRNLMVVRGELVWIDFQDALLGPRVYDLVALLNDSYQDFDRRFVLARLEDYGAAAAFSPQDHADLVREFDRVTVQRKLKDAGRFVFIERRRGNPAFLPFVSPTIEKVCAALARLAPDDADMAELLALLKRILGEELGR
jgi:aminoglycoside/choline kinase family phosphotransferase